MFSGKSSELLRRLSTYTAVRKRALYINHSLDERNEQDVFSTHNPQLKEVLTCDYLRKIKIDSLSKVPEEYLDEADVIGIDEGQFFDNLEIAATWVDNYQKDVLIASLDGDLNRNKFGKVLDLVPKADDVVKLKAKCVKCSRHKKRPTDAPFTHKRTTPVSAEVVDVGGAEKWEALCRICFLTATRPLK
jgi:thymidine kinase